MSELAKAYVQIIPTAQGISGALEDILGDEAEKSGKSVGGKFGNAIGTGIKAAAGALTAATGTVIAFAKGSVDAGKDFDAAMSQVAATSGKTMADLDKEVGSVDTSFGHFDGTMREFAQYLGAKTAFSATEVAEGLNYMALAGYDLQESMEMMPNVLSLAAAGNIDLARASDMVTDAQSALGLEVDETMVMVDQMAVAAATTNTSVEQLGDAYLKIGATARSVSGGTQELATMLGVLADNGIKGTEGGTHLRNILLAMNPTTNAACAAWERLGLTAYDTEGSLRPLPDIMVDLADAMSDMTDEEKTHTLSQMFNKTDLAAVNALLGTSEKRFEEVSAAIGDCSGAAAQMADTQLANLAGDVTLFQSALEGAKIAVSDQLTPTLREFTQFGTNALSTLTEAFQEGGLSGAMEALGGILSEGLNMVITKLPGMVDAGMQLLGALAQGLVDNLPAIIDSALQILTMLSEKLIENLPMLVEAALQIMMMLALGLADALPELIPSIVSVMLEIVDTLLDNIDLLLDAALQLMIGLAQGLILALPELIAKAPEIILELVLALAESLPKLLEMGWELIKALGQGIAEAFPGVTEKITGWIDSVREFLSNAWETIKNVVQVAIMFLGSILQAAFDILTLPWRFIWENFGEEITIIWEVIKGVVGGAIEWVKEKIQIVMDAVLAVVKPILDGIRDTFERNLALVKAVVSKVFGWVKDTITNRLNAVKAIVSTVLNAVKKTFTDIFDKIKEFLSPIIDWLKGIFDFEWSLPKPKLPHFSISGSFSLSPPSVPSLSIDWYGKAMDNAMILSGATIFGMSGDKLLGGGEDGDEVIAGAGTLMGMIRDAVGDGTREYNQVINITSPQPLSPYEIARQTRNATRDMVLAARV